MECYLDNAATTKVFPEVSELVQHMMSVDYGNPSSLHMKGVESERYTKEAAERIAATLRCAPGNIIFTSGGTESNNMALIGAARAHRRAGKHIISTCFEHPSVYEPLTYLESEGYEVTYLPVDHMGKVSPQDLEDAMREDTILVSVMLVNNEVGSVSDIEALSQVIKKRQPSTLFHVDAIQAYGKMQIRPQKMGIDLMSVSGHKIHGPKGVGFLYVGDKVRILPLMYGGGQQKGMRSGTYNTPGIAGLGLAAQMMYDHLKDHREYLYKLKKYFVTHVTGVEGAIVNACDPDCIEESAAHIVSVSFPGVRSEVLLHALEESQIYVSSGSACSSHHPGISGTLQAIGVADDLLDATLRFSFSIHTREEELTYTIEELQRLVPMLARYRRS